MIVTVLILAVGHQNGSTVTFGRCVMLNILGAANQGTPMMTYLVSTYVRTYFGILISLIAVATVVSSVLVPTIIAIAITAIVIACVVIIAKKRSGKKPGCVPFPMGNDLLIIVCVPPPLLRPL